MLLLPSFRKTSDLKSLILSQNKMFYEAKLILTTLVSTDRRIGKCFFTTSVYNFALLTSNNASCHQLLGEEKFTEICSDLAKISPNSTSYVDSPIYKLNRTFKERSKSKNKPTLEAPQAPWSQVKENIICLWLVDYCCHLPFVLHSFSISFLRWF